MKTQATVLLCAHVRSEIEPAELRATLPDTVELTWVDELCQRPDAIGESVATEDGPMGVVVGVCRDARSDLEYTNQARRSGIDPFGVQVVSLGVPPFEETATLRRLRAVAARASKYGGSSPANSKTILPGLNGLVSRRDLFTLPPIRYVATPTIDRSSCVTGQGCELCVVQCPHDAMKIEDDRVVVDRERCKSCGICVAACPARGIEFPGNSADQIEAETAAYLTDADGEDGCALEFACRNAVGGDETPGLGDRVGVACACMVPASALLGALANGAGVVSLRTCGESCPNGGGQLIEGTVGYGRSVLAAVGDDPDRIELNAEGPPNVSKTPSMSSVADPPPSLFGAGAAARAIVQISDLAGAGNVSLEHENSPLGSISLNEDSCTACGTCVDACPAGALKATEVDGRWSLDFDPSLCVGCGECTSVCPESERGAITLSRTTDLAVLRSGVQTLIESDIVGCKKCGDPITSERVLARLTEMLGDDASSDWMRELCMDCRTLAE